ncbi:hypothetical protein QPK87_07215 [Kamptonema cortianum]|nr:hypothetical protein [Geitlerinema splendidum]MDK3156364.1 hypothetical protein [Kamptonema cortianum]
MSPKASDKKASRQLTEDDLKRLPWRSVGPAIMGGRISDICFAPGNPKSWYAGYASGGLWRTKNLGTTFEPIFDNEETSSIGSVVVCDASPDWSGWDKDVKKSDRKEQGKEKIIWVGTGEGNGRNSSSWGNGVYRSTDSGKTWDHCGLENTHDIPRLAVDPRNPDVCYAAALGHLWGHNPDRGLYKTKDGGKTWDLVLSIDSKTGCCDVIVDPNNPDTVYAAMYARLRTPYSFQSGGEKGGIFKSTDAGKTWKQLTKGLPKQTGRIGLDIFLGDTKKLIAVVESTQEGGNSIRDDRMKGGGVFRSDDGGESWRRMSHRSPRAFYFSKIKFDPKDDNRVYMLGWTTEVSDDGGDTFRGGWGDLLHADHHAIIVNPEDTSHIVVATDGGAYQTFDRGETWDFLNTIAVGQFYNIALDQSDPYRISGGLQDNGSWVWPSATHREEPKDDAARVPQTGITNADIEFILWGDGFHTDFDPNNPNIMFAEWQGGNLTRVDFTTGERRHLIPEAREGEPRHRFNWNSPFFVSAHDPESIYLGGNMVFKLAASGTKWKKISGDLTTADPNKMTTVGSNAETHCTVVSLTESPLSKGLLFAGSDDGLIHVTQNDGKSWENITPPTVKGRYVSRLHASYHNPGTCYATIDGHRGDDMDPCVLVTEDFGKSWKDITANLPKGRSAMVIRDDRFNPDVLYVGTENAVYVSTNKGKSWVKLHGKALPTVPVYDIQQHSRETDVVIGTHGRSVYVLDDAHWLSEFNDSVAGAGLHLFSVRDVKPKWRLAYNGLWSHKLFRAPNPPMGAKIDYWINEYTGDDLSITIENEKGVTVKKLSGSNAPGYNRVVWNLQPESWHQLNDKGEEPFMNDFHARPGVYKVKLKMGDLTAEGSFQVLE